MRSIDQTIAIINALVVPGVASLLSRRDKLLSELGGVYAVLFSARSLLPLRYTTMAYGQGVVTTANVEALFPKAAFGVAEGEATNRSYRRLVERLTSLHNAWVEKSAGFARPASKAGVEAITLLLASSSRTKFVDEAKAWQGAFSTLKVDVTDQLVNVTSGDDGDVYRAVTSSDLLDQFLVKAGSRKKAAKAASAKVAKNAAAKKAAAKHGKAVKAVANAKADPEGVDAGVKAAGESKGGTLPSAVVVANTATVGHDVEAKLPGSTLDWNAFMGTAKQSVDALISDTSLSLEAKRQKLGAFGDIVIAGLAALKAVADTMAKAKPVSKGPETQATIDPPEKAAKPPVVAAKKTRKAKPAKLAKVEVIVIDEAPGDSPADTAKANEAEARVIVTQTKSGPVMSIAKSAKPKRAARSKPRDAVAALASNPALTVVSGGKKPTRAERKAANKAAFAAQRAATLAAKANGLAH
jgi:hypothetical protein